MNYLIYVKYPNITTSNTKVLDISSWSQHNKYSRVNMSRMQESITIASKPYNNKFRNLIEVQRKIVYSVKEKFISRIQESAAVSSIQISNFKRLRLQ